MHMRTSYGALVAGMMFYMAACTPPTTKPIVRTFPRMPPEADAVGRLLVFTRAQIGGDFKALKFRGEIANPYSEDVDGVRVVIKFLSERAADSRERERFQRILDTHLPSGALAPLHFDLQAMAGSGGFVIEAYAIKRGGVELPIPPDWK